MDTVLLCAASVGVLMLALWVVSLVIRDVSIVDPAWGPAFVVVAAMALVAGDGDLDRRRLLFVLTALWGLRLGLYLVARKLGDREEDRRYQKMRKERGAAFPLYSLLVVFGFQALLVVIISLPVSISSERPAALTALVIPGVLLWTVGLFFEGVGDEQLRRFKAKPDSKGKVMDQGLWRLTRHPNYFGDFCVWWGLWLIALPAGNTWWTVIGPIIMSVLLIRVSGAGLLEKDIGDRRPGYKEYIERTSGFFPLPPKKG